MNWTRTELSDGRIIYTSAASTYTVQEKRGVYYPFSILGADGKVIGGPNLKNFRYIADAMKAAVALTTGQLHVAGCYRGGASFKFVYVAPAFFRGREDAWSSESTWDVIAGIEPQAIDQDTPRRRQPADRNRHRQDNTRNGQTVGERLNRLLDQYAQGLDMVRGVGVLHNVGPDGETEPAGFPQTLANVE